MNNYQIWFIVLISGFFFNTGLLVRGWLNGNSIDRSASEVGIGTYHADYDPSQDFSEILHIGEKKHLEDDGLPKEEEKIMEKPSFQGVIPTDKDFNRFSSYPPVKNNLKEKLRLFNDETPNTTIKRGEVLTDVSLDVSDLSNKN